MEDSLLDDLLAAIRNMRPAAMQRQRRMKQEQEWSMDADIQMPASILH
ncbi:hypothetical protein [Peribacillus sp. SCS-37]